MTPHVGTELKFRCGISRLDPIWGLEKMLSAIAGAVLRPLLSGVPAGGSTSQAGAPGGAPRQAPAASARQAAGEATAASGLAPSSWSGAGYLPPAASTTAVPAAGGTSAQSAAGSAPSSATLPGEAQQAPSAPATQNAAPALTHPAPNPGAPAMPAPADGGHTWRSSTYAPPAQEGRTQPEQDAEADRRAAIAAQERARVTGWLSTMRTGDESSPLSLLRGSSDGSPAYRHAAGAYAEFSGED